jgi:hypothetical protein
MLVANRVENLFDALVLCHGVLLGGRSHKRLPVRGLFHARKTLVGLYYLTVGMSKCGFRPEKTMSGNNLRRVTTDKTVSEKPDERLTPLVGEADPSAHSAVSRDAITESVLDSAIDAITEGDTAVGDGLVTQTLDEILLALIASSNDQTHGTELIEKLSNQFDAQLSPGTVYPRLHDLDADGILAVHELVQTKQYSIDDTDTAASKIEHAARRHLIIGMFLQSSLDAM